MTIARWTPPVTLTRQEQFLLKRLGRVRKLLGFLRVHRHELFNDVFQAELASMYRTTGAGSHETRTAPETGCASKRNGELLALAVGRFEVFVTADRNLSYQQDPSAFDIAIVVLLARSNRLEDLRALVPRLLEVLPTAARRAVTLVQR